MNTQIFIKKIFHNALGKPYFATNDVKVGKNVKFGRNVVFNCKRVRIGDGTVFHSNINIDTESFEIGDYGTVYGFCFFPGPGTLTIGHNFWMGTGALLDSMGGTAIGNNVCIGSQSVLWTHMVYGDVMYGCRFNSVKPLVIEDDAWLSGHCLISPVRVGKRSLAMFGSLITRDMECDRTYAGAPAEDVTDKLGPQFKITSLDERLVYLSTRIQEFARIHDIKDISKYVQIVSSGEEMAQTGNNLISFNVSDRTYTKRNTSLEYKLVRYLLPGAKFIPS